MTAVRRQVSPGPGPGGGLIREPAGVEPAALRLVLLAAVAAPVVFPDTARRLFSMAPADPRFEDRYRQTLKRL